MRTIALVLAMASLLAVPCLAETTPATGRFVQDRFAIGFWVDPPADQINDARYREIAEANFTVIIGNFSARNPKEVAKQLALCRKHGLKAIVVGDVRKPETLPNGSACWGYYVGDEPGAGFIPDYKKIVEGIRKARPGKLAYFNLYPDYCPIWALGTPTYDEYIARFGRETQCDVLCMDYYPLLTPNDDGRDGYCGNLEVMRKYSVELNVPFWNFFNTLPYGPHYDPTESHLRWQVYTSLAYGAKGILYFCYWTPKGNEFPKGGAIITAEGLRTRHYEQAKRINGAVKNLGRTLMKLTSVKVVRVRRSEDSVKLLEGTPIKSLSQGGDYLVGVFTHADGRRAVMLNDYDHNYTAWPTVEFNAPEKQVVEIDQTNGKEKPILDDSPAMPGLQLSLDSGEGRLFLMPAKEGAE